MSEVINNLSHETTNGTKQCRKCLTTYPVSQFSKHGGTKDKLDNRCKTCVKQVKAMSKINNKDAKNDKLLDTIQTDPQNKNWQGGKIVGNVFKRKCKEAYYYIASVDGSQKSFGISKYGGDLQAKQAADEYVAVKNEELGLSKNKYKIIHDSDNNPLYIIVQLSKGYVMLTDYDKLDIIKTHCMFVSKSGNENAKQYCRLQSNTGIVVSYHKMISGYEMTDHISGYPLDDRRANLRETNASDNNKNKTCINKTLIENTDTNKVSVSIVYTITDQFKKKRATKVFDTKEEANEWIKYKTIQLNQHIFKQDRVDMAKKFESIMETHSDGFKWHDMIDNDTIDNEISDEKDDRIQKYSKFLTINANFDINTISSSGRGVKHITDNDIEYKFCSKCDSWKAINLFYITTKNSDQLDKYCKACKKHYKTIEQV